jgi:hypothetical protein
MVRKHLVPYPLSWERATDEKQHLYFPWLIFYEINAVLPLVTRSEGSPMRMLSSQTDQNYQNDDLNNQLTDFKRGGGGRGESVHVGYENLE